MCHHFQGAGGCFSAGDKKVVVVVDNVGIVDGGCVGVVNGDVAALGGVLGCSMKVCVAVSVVWGVAWVLKSLQIVVLSLGGSVWRAAHRHSGSSLVCVAVSSVLGAVWVLASLQVVVSGSVWVSASSSKTAPWKSSRAWAAIDRQSPAPCPSVSHFRHSLSVPFCIPSSWPSSSPFLCACSPFSCSSFPFASYPSLYPSPHFLLPSLYPSL